MPNAFDNSAGPAESENAHRQFVTGPTQDQLRGQHLEPTMRDLQCTLDHRIASLRHLNDLMSYSEMRRRLCEDILPLVSTLARMVNQQG